MVIDQITSIQDIVDLAMAGFADWGRYGCVTTKRLDDLILFNYTTQAQYRNGWNFFETVSRGLIINRVTGEIVARPFDKFFNWGEGGRTSTAPIVSVTAKMDGSLGILYRHNGEYRIATRGSFDSEQARWATKHWQEQYADVKVPDELTLMFEIIYPENRVVVDYGGKSYLVLIGARNRFTGEYLSFIQLRELSSQFDFYVPMAYTTTELNIIQARLGEMTNAEGFVVEFADGQFFKFKTAEYLRLHKLIFSMSFAGALKAMQQGELDSYIADLPDEFLGDVKKWVAQIMTTVQQVEADVERAFADAPKTTRKDFALWVQANHPKLKAYLFAMLDGEPIRPIIYAKHEFKEA